MAQTGVRRSTGVSCLAVIPARGGSRGIPRKNLRTLLGKPLLAYIIGEALAARTLSKVVVSTDDADIALVARRYGADVVDRPTEISGDDASSESAVQHALETMRTIEGWTPDITVMLQCTAPLTLAEDIDGTVASMLERRADSCLSVARSHQFLWRLSADASCCEGVNHNRMSRPRRQEMSEQFVETGAVYAMRTASFLSTLSRFCGRTVMYKMPAERHLEVDEPNDLVKAEAMLRDRANRD